MVVLFKKESKISIKDAILMVDAAESPQRASYSINSVQGPTHRLGQIYANLEFTETVDLNSVMTL